MAVLADGLDLVGIQLLFTTSGNENDSGDHSRREPQSRASDQEAGGVEGEYSRCATNAEHVQLRLVETHVA